MYESQDSEERLAAFGFKPEDFASNVVNVWPENHSAVVLFGRLSTQWRVGMGGCTGLDYGVLFHKMDRMNLPPDEYEQLEDDMRVLEQAALTQMSLNQKEANDRN